MWLRESYRQVEAGAIKESPVQLGKVDSFFFLISPWMKAIYLTQLSSLFFAKRRSSGRKAGGSHLRKSAREQGAILHEENDILKKEKAKKNGDILPRRK